LQNHFSAVGGNARLTLLFFRTAILLHLLVLLPLRLEKHQKRSVVARNQHCMA
jgi:hypothetical protein